MSEQIFFDSCCSEALCTVGCCVKATTTRRITFVASKGLSLQKLASGAAVKAVCGSVS